MKNFIKRTIDRIRSKPLLVKPVVSNCANCKFNELSSFDLPCNNCTEYNKFQKHCC